MDILTKLKLCVLVILLMALSAATGAAYVYADAINSKAAYFHPYETRIVWGFPDSGVVIDSIAPAIEARIEKKGGKK